MIDYPSGLKIAAISSKKAADQLEVHQDNKNLYNDKELINDGDIDWYDYGFRNYDPQIGRFVQLDPLAATYSNFSNYAFVGNNPILYSDPTGIVFFCLNVLVTIA